MSRGCCITCLAAITGLLFTVHANGYELSGGIAIEGRLFSHIPVFEGQEHHSGSLALNGELYHEFATGASFTIAPFARLDSADSERTHVDLRECNFIHPEDQWEVKIGVSKIFWGATEFVHLVDIVNQTDLVEEIDGEEKLGQPMLHISFIRDWGVFDGLVLPYFRERTFPGQEGRLRGEDVIGTGRAVYESRAEQHHIDFALRFSRSAGGLDWGVSQFFGTGREPAIIEEKDESGNSVLAPYYRQISQTGLDAQYVRGEWLWKGEALYRSGQGRSFAALTFGFEYTMYGIFNTGADLGFIAEYVFDDRDDTAATVYDNDLMAGLRLAVNDMEGTELLAGMIRDVELSSTLLSLEASRRWGESVKFKLSGGLFTGMDEQDPAYGLRQDDYLRVEAILYF